MFAIEKGVDQPKSNNKYPWRDMVPGDSFLVPTAEGGDEKLMRALTSQCSTWGRQCEHMFRARVVDDGVRVWCQEK